METYKKEWVFFFVRFGLVVGGHLQNPTTTLATLCCLWDFGSYYLPQFDLISGEASFYKQ